MSGRDDENVWTEPTTRISPVKPVREALRTGSCILKLVSGPGAPAELAVTTDEVIIGRAHDATIRIASAELSRHHVKISRRGEEYRCEDLESRNGVYLNGVRIHSATLRDGDTLQLGSAVLTFHEGR